jgi:hypothetical protein
MLFGRDRHDPFGFERAPLQIDLRDLSDRETITIPSH